MADQPFGRNVDGVPHIGLGKDRLLEPEVFQEVEGDQVGQLGGGNRAIHELDELLADARRQHNWVILDLTDVRFLDTSSVAVIVSHWKKLEARGGKLMLAGAQQRYIRALWITGLASRMSLYDDVETAIAAAGSARTARSGD